MRQGLGRRPEIGGGGVGRSWRGLDARRGEHSKGGQGKSVHGWKGKERGGGGGGGVGGAGEGSRRHSEPERRRRSEAAAAAAVSWNGESRG